MNLTLNEAWARDGFVVISGLWSAAICAKVKERIASRVSEHGHHGGVLVGLAARDDFFAELVSESALVSVLRRLLGPNIEFLSDKVAFKSGAQPAASPWHQDWRYWEGAHKVSVWIALDPATTENGALKLLPGSHKTLSVHDGIAAPGEAFGKRLGDGVVDESAAVTIECGVGDAVVFHDLTLHASHPNTAGVDRYAWIGTYRDATLPDLDYDWAVARRAIGAEEETPVS